MDIRRKEQKDSLKELSAYFRKLEKEADENNIDLDVFISEYKDDGYAVYATELVSMKANTQSRKEIFSKSGKEKITKLNPAKSKE